MAASVVHPYLFLLPTEHWQLATRRACSFRVCFCRLECTCLLDPSWSCWACTNTSHACSQAAQAAHACSNANLPTPASNQQAHVEVMQAMADLSPADNKVADLGGVLLSGLQVWATIQVGGHPRCLSSCHCSCKAISLLIIGLFGNTVLSWLLMMPALA